ncbi:unnamed protein product [Linum trigynum]
MITVGDVAIPEFFAATFGCNWSNEPSKYLGFPLGAKVNAISTWDPIINKFEQRLDGWKSRFLSFGGRLVLNKSTLSGQPIYFFSLLRAPIGVLNRFEAIQRRFLWSGAGDNHKTPLIKWEICKASIENGGLGIRDMACFNKAMLSKWLWKYATERESWWRQLIEFKYKASNSQWQSKQCRNGFGSSVWANISKEYGEFWKVAVIDPGGGAGVSFWNDCWLPQTTLAHSFPRVAAAAANPEALLPDVISRSGEGPNWNIEWNIDFSLVLRGGAERERESFFTLLNSIDKHRIVCGPSRLAWCSNPDSSFSVRSMYRLLTDGRFHGVPNFPSESVWRKSIPSKINAFMWMVAHKRILTMDKIQQRGCSIANRCCMCCRDEESVDHLFTRCEFGLEIWTEVRRMCGDSFAPQEQILDTIKCWKSDVPDTTTDWIGFCILHAVCWQIWLERNRRVFQDASRSAKEVFWIAIRSTADWLVAKGKISRIQVMEWLRPLRLN